MKKILFTIFILAGFIQLNQAQEIGIRFGDAIGGKYAVDGVIGLAGFSRINFNCRVERPSVAASRRALSSACWRASR